MKIEELAVVQGWADTRQALAHWRERPSTVARPWALWSAVVTFLLLAATWGVAMLTVPDIIDVVSAEFAGVTAPPVMGDFGYVLFRNALVLALHALACVAGFMAGSSMPQLAEGYTGVWAKVHRLAGPIAIAFVCAATMFSLATQAYILGGAAASLAVLLDVSPLVLIVGLMPHAVPELFALFLPLAAWTVASRRGEWNQLLAATFVTVAIAAPILVVSAAIEVWVTPEVLLALSGR
jgi:hypothetical protein